MNILRIFIGLMVIMMPCRCHACEQDGNYSLRFGCGYKNNDMEIHIIQIDNQTKNKYYFWVNPTPIRQIAPEFLIRCYFWSIPEGYDFAFGHLITEPNIEFGDYEIKLGYNFIKLLSPGESFRLIINDDEARDDYKNRLVIISEKEFQKYFDTIPDFFLYKDDHIIIR